jgi:NAD(P)H-hydrate epimerase
MSEAPAIAAPAALPRLPQRPPDGHKGTFGTVCVLGGQAAPPRVMLGGPALAAMGALRAGAGLAVLAVPAPLMAAALTVAPSATGLSLPVDAAGNLQPSAVAEILDRYLPQCDCLVLGPGLGAEAAQRQVVARLIQMHAPPMVIDADALNALAGLPDLHRDLKAASVLTPHPGEFRTLAKALSIRLDPVDPGARPEAALALARRLGCVVVLKGAGTVVSDGRDAWVNSTGSVALATAGTGDVLAGVIGGLIAQYARPNASTAISLYDCARLGVHLHGLAADRWSESHGHAGMLAADLLLEIPGAMSSLR